MWQLKVSEGSDNPWLVSVNNHIGRQHWEFDPHAGSPEERAEVDRVRSEFTKNRFRIRQCGDVLMRLQLKKENPIVAIPPPVTVAETEKVTTEAVTTTLRRAISILSTMQVHDGHWPAESSGPLFFLPPLVMALHITGAINEVLSPQHQMEIKRYIYNHQNEDGGWGLHIEGESSMFGSTLNYIALRLMGEPSHHHALLMARQWILHHGGALGIPSWGKFWLAVLGIYEWDGCNPIPPEFWLLPKILPIHPGKMMCYCRLVYMPMSYLYGKRYVGPIDECVRSLREELYNEPYHEINWNKARNTCAKEDLYYPHPLVQDIVWGFLQYVVEPILKTWPFTMLREKAMQAAMQHVHYEDQNSRYFCIGSIEKVLCLIACWLEDPNSDAYKFHLARIPDYLWLAEDGLKMQSFGSQSWDAAFSIQAIIGSGLAQEYGPTLRKAHQFIKDSQVRENPTGKYKEMYRHGNKGAWTFSTQDHGWPVSDCTAEGLKAALLLSQMSEDVVGKAIEPERLFDAINVILSYQSSNGGFSAWEPQQAYRWLEKFNPTEIFEDVIIEREYVECTSSAIQALVLFKKLYPDHRRKEIEACISKGLRYIEDEQNPDGSWFGRWGICYTYGTWFGVGCLAACGRSFHNCEALRKACHFLISKQLPDGGWGESYLSSIKQEYINLEGNRSNLVNTAWALLTLIKAGQGEVDPTPIQRGVRLLINSQMEDGDFPQQEVRGIFMKNCTLNYGGYRSFFPIWALGEYRCCL